MERALFPIKSSDIFYLFFAVLLGALFIILKSPIPFIYPAVLLIITYLLIINRRLHLKDHALFRKLAKLENLKFTASVSSPNQLGKKEKGLMSEGVNKSIKNYYKGKVENWTLEVYEYSGVFGKKDNFHSPGAFEFYTFELSHPKKDFGQFLIWHRREIHHLRPEYLTDLQTTIKGLKLHFATVYGDSTKINCFFSNTPILDQIIKQKMTFHLEGQGNSLRLYLPCRLFNKKSFENIMHLIERITNLV